MLALVAMYLCLSDAKLNYDENLTRFRIQVHEGAKTFLYQEYLWLSVFVVLMCIALSVIFSIADVRIFNFEFTRTSL